MSLRIAFLALFFSSFLSYGSSIRTIRYQGLKRTKEEFLNQLIKSKEGSEFDSLTLVKDEQILRNLNLFFSLDAEVIYKDSIDVYDIVFVLREAKYVYPLVSASGFEGAFKLQLGVNDINWGGRNKTLGIIYQYYDRHSLSVYQKTPRHRDAKTGHEISVSKYSTIEPLYFENQVADFNFDNYAISLGGNYWLSTKSNVHIGGMLMYEEYMQITDEDLPIPKRMFDFFKYQLRTRYEYNGVNQLYELFNGFRYDIYAETIQTKDYANASFLKLITSLRYYKYFDRTNIAFNYRFGIATNNYSPFSPFVLDGFLNVRGIGNRVSRGTAENIINLEVRQSFINSKRIIFQAVGFLDVGSLRQPGATMISMFDSESMNYYSGIGLRLHSKVFYKAVFRVDYAFSAKDISNNGLSFGLGQFF